MNLCGTLIYTCLAILFAYYPFYLFWDYDYFAGLFRKFVLLVHINLDMQLNGMLTPFYSVVVCHYLGPGLCSRYSKSLQTGRSGDRIPVEARFSAPFQTGPGAHPASYTMVTGSFPEVKRPGRGVNHLHPPSAEVQERVELYFCSLSVPSWQVISEHYLVLPLFIKSLLQFKFKITYIIDE
jgi:hypothetical protein